MGKLVKRWEWRAKYNLGDLMDFHDAMDAHEKMKADAAKKNKGGL